MPVLATRNPHKVRELERMLGGGITLDPLPADVELPPETGTTYAQNAVLKARAAAAATGYDAIADDSGVEAQALGGRPGVRSARYAGPDATDAENLALLQAEVPPGSPLRYVCVMAHVTAQGTVTTFEGTCEGTMAPAPRGADGFGYDPVFLPTDDPHGRTMAELAPEEKDAISHRGRAVRKLGEWL